MRKLTSIKGFLLLTLVLNFTFFYVTLVQLINFRDMLYNLGTNLGLKAYFNIVVVSMFAMGNIICLLGNKQHNKNIKLFLAANYLTYISYFLYLLFISGIAYNNVLHNVGM